MKLLSNTDYYTEVERFFYNENYLDMAVAFFGIASVSLVSSKTKKPIRIICNLESSACNPYAIKKLQENENVAVRTNRKLHAKVLLQENEVIVGSANISSNGLAFEEEELEGWLEMGVLVRDESVVSDSKEWFREQWNNSILVTNEILDLAELEWKKRRNQRVSIHTDESLLKAALKNMSSFVDRNIYFVIYRDSGLSEEAEAALENAKSIHSALSEKIGCYEGWSQIPDDSYLIDIYYGPRGGVLISGIYQTPADPLVEKFSYENSEDGEGEVKICFKKHSICGYGLSEDDKSLLKKNIEQLWNYDSDEEASIVPFSVGLRIIERSI